MLTVHPPLCDDEGVFGGGWWWVCSTACGYVHVYVYIHEEQPQ